MSTPLRLTTRSAWLTDPGQVRDHNEDAVGVFEPSDPRLQSLKGWLYIIADGMGGHAGGQVASRCAVDTIAREYYADLTQDAGAGLVQAVQAANAAIYRQAQDDPALGNMGTTAVVLAVRQGRAFVASVGDSRAYLVRGETITQTTTDHSLVAEKVRAGILTPKEARRSAQRNVITRALGRQPDVQVDSFEGELQPSDYLVLCSDGLTAHVEDHEIRMWCEEIPPPEDIAAGLVRLANKRGGSDNASVIVAAVVAAPPAGWTPAHGRAPTAPVPPHERRSVA